MVAAEQDYHQTMLVLRFVVGKDLQRKDFQGQVLQFNQREWTKVTIVDQREIHLQFR